MRIKIKAWVLVLGSLEVALLLTSYGGPQDLRALSGYRCAGMAFSPDGSALALAYDAHESPHRGMVLELHAWPSLKRGSLDVVEAAGVASFSFRLDVHTVAELFLSQRR